MHDSLHLAPKGDDIRAEAIGDKVKKQQVTSIHIEPVFIRPRLRQPRRRRTR